LEEGQESAGQVAWTVDGYPSILSADGRCAVDGEHAYSQTMSTGDVHRRHFSQRQHNQRSARSSNQEAPNQRSCTTILEASLEAIGCGFPRGGEGDAKGDNRYAS
jgi:hypothetical protein